MGVSLPAATARTAVNKFDDSVVRARLNDYLRSQTGPDATISALKRYTVGFSWITFGFNARWRDTNGLQQHDLILRIGPAGGLFAPYTAQPQFAALQALEQTAVPLPKVYWWSDDSSILGGPFFICENVVGVASLPWVEEGKTAFPETKRQTLADQLIDALAALHRFEWRGTGLEIMDHGINVDNAAQQQIDIWEQLLRGWQLRIYPQAEWAIEWLRARCPVAPRISVIHGDYRIGNFLEHEGQITAILDWEMVHLGDPHEDLGYMCLRAFRGSSRLMCHLISREELYATYQERSGIPVSARAVHFYEVFNTLKVFGIHVGAARSFENGNYNDLRMAAIGAHASRVLLQLEKLIAGAP